MSNVIKKKRRIKYKNVCFFTLFILIIIISIFVVANMHIKNIYIKNNAFVSDQTIIDEAGLHNYPKVYKVSVSKIKKSLESNPYIKKANVKRQNLFREITITIEENRPLIYYAYDESYLLTDGTKVKDSFNLPILINQTPEDILLKLLKKLDALDRDILIRISEIKYSPSDVDQELFYLTMNDGNDVYINFNEFSKLNDYIDMIQQFDKAKGTLHLDSGNYLEKY